MAFEQEKHAWLRINEDADIFARGKDDAGTLYPTMQRLEELGLAEREALHDRKIVYNITEKGIRIMNETCLAFVKTFYGIFHDHACARCDHYLQRQEKK